MIALAFNMLNFLNICYMTGGTVSGCPLEAGTGHMFIPVQYQTWMSYTFRDANNNLVDPNNQTSWNQTLTNAAEYKPAPTGITDIFGFFTWVVNGVKLIINTLLSPIYGFPQFIVKYFWVPEFIMIYISGVLGFIQILGLYEFTTGRPILG